MPPQWSWAQKTPPQGYKTPQNKPIVTNMINHNGWQKYQVTPQNNAISYISELKKEDFKQWIVRVGKTFEFYDRSDQSYQLPKKSG